MRVYSMEIIPIHCGEIPMDHDWVCISTETSLEVIIRYGNDFTHNNIKMKVFECSKCKLITFFSNSNTK